MTNKVFNILSAKHWTDQSSDGKKKLFRVLLIWCVFSIFSIIYFFINLFFSFNDSCLICNFLLVIFPVIAIYCALRGKMNCSLNAVFFLPVVLYAFQIFDFNPDYIISKGIYFTVFSLFAGLFFLLIFAESNFKIFVYFIISLLTIGFQLMESELLVETFNIYQPFALHPIIIFSFLFIILFFLRVYYLDIIKNQQTQISDAGKSVTKVLRDSPFSIIQLLAERDETGNILHFTVEKVNLSFEATFNINLYEVQGQKADYIFDLLFKGKFDFNKIILSRLKQNIEFHAVNLERWFKIMVLQPDYQHFYVIFEDISASKARIASLEENKLRYKVLLEAIPDIFFVLDKDGTYEDFVIKESDLFKVEDVNIIGSTIFQVGFPENMADKIFGCIQSCIKTNSIETIEYSMNTPNGTFLFEMRLAKLNDNSVISVARDITKRKTAEFRLEKALLKAEESDRLKSIFLANLSHEIRTPMNVITNFTRILAEAELDNSEKLELSDAISQNGRQLLNMIDNSIHLSKIESQSVVITQKFCKMNDLFQNIYNKHSGQIPVSKPVKLKIANNVPTKEFGFETDAVILVEILSMLIDNGIKYTLKGEINLAYEMIRNEQIKFIVSDTGIGIPEDEHKNIFKRFYRVKNNINEQTPGSGLGLPIVKHYVEMLGGKLEFETNPGNGSTFWFILPFKNGKGFKRSK